ncbi:MAG: peptidase M28 family protein, partial [Pontixanthobacter sp.]
MKNMTLALAALSLSVSLPAVAVAQHHGTMTLEEGADKVLTSDTIAWDFVEGITTEVGPRQAGTEAEQRGRDWAMAWLKANGFANVAEEPYMMDTWVRGTETAEVVSPFAQPFHVTALGTSASTGPDGITAEVVFFRTVAELQAAPEGSLKGKIAYIS